jgi:HEPN domain-containing protein
MPRKNSQYATDWMRVAEKDWKRVNRALEDGDAEEAGFWLQQAAEKYLKAYLLFKGWTLRRVHDLEVLLNEATNYQRELSRYVSACQKISGYYLAERYPIMDGPSLTAEDVLGSREDIEPLIDYIRRELS